MFVFVNYLNKNHQFIIFLVNGLLTKCYISISLLFSYLIFLCLIGQKAPIALSYKKQKIVTLRKLVKQIDQRLTLRAIYETVRKDKNQIWNYGLL